MPPLWFETAESYQSSDLAFSLVDVQAQIFTISRRLLSVNSREASPTVTGVFTTLQTQINS